jgi:hypothetical protein
MRAPKRQSEPLSLESTDTVERAGLLESTVNDERADPTESAEAYERADYLEGICHIRRAPVALADHSLDASVPEGACNRHVEGIRGRHRLTQNTVVPSAALSSM